MAMAKNKFDRFIEANNAVYPANLTLEILSTFGKYGVFHVDNADVVLKVSKLESVAPELIAVTWMNESTFRFYCEPNKNNSRDFRKWDVGPMQLNVGYTTADLDVGFFKADGIELSAAFGGSVFTYVGGDEKDLFDGSPVDNLRLGARKLKALGRAAIIGKNKEILMEKVSLQVWAGLDEWTKNIRRAALYTRPDARNDRIASYTKFAPMFQKFFEIYSKE